LIKRSQTVETDLNVKPGQKFCVALTALVMLMLPAVPVTAWAGLAVGAGSAAIVGLNGGFYRFLIGRRGILFTLATLPVHLIYYTCCGLSVMIALYQWHTSSGALKTQGAARRERIDRGAQSIPRPLRARVAGRLARWTARSR
jgi:hypothetical protein